LVTLVVLPAALLAACGAPSQPTGPSSPLPSASAPPAVVGETAASGETRLVKHALGETEVPANPQRIAALDHTIVSSLISVGVTPGAMPSDSVPWLGAYREVLPAGVDPATIPTVGTDDQPNIEGLAAIDPDMILVSDYTAEELFDQLSRIAPTVAFEWINNGAWQQRFDKITAAAGRSEEAEAVRRRYRQVIDELPQAARTTRVAFIRPSGDGQFRVDSTAEAFAGSVANDAGIPILAPEGVGEVAEGSGFITLSGELLSVLEDADLIVVADWTIMGEDEPGVAVFERNPLWQRLPAVQAGRVVSVPGPIYNGGNYMAAELLLRTIAEAVSASGVSADDTPNP